MSRRDQFAPPTEDDIPLETEDEYRERIRQERGLAEGAGDLVGRLQPVKHPRAAWLKVLMLGVVGLAGWETGATLIHHTSAPTTGDWKAAAARVKFERKPDEDALLFAPLWVEPLGRLHFSDQLTVEQQLLSDVDRFAKVWQVSIRGARHPWLRQDKPVLGWSFGDIRVDLFEQRPVEVLFDFTANIKDAQVEREGNNRKRPCILRGHRYVCDPKQGWNWVGPHMAEVGHRPYRCIFAHPVDKHVMRIHFRSVPLGRTLVGYTGIDDFENRKRAKAPVHLKVLVGSNALGTVHHINEWPWHRFEFNTSEHAGQPKPVSFEITTDHAYARTFCFSAEARK